MGRDIMVIATERRRDAINVRRHDTERLVSMLTQSITFGDPRLPARFWDKVRVLDNGCWEWTGARRQKAGYGLFHWQGLLRIAHRVSYEALIGLIPKGLESDHLCRNRACVRPEHIEPVSHRENVRRGVRPSQMRAKRHCPHGHPYEGENLYVRPNGDRECRTCHRTQERARRRRVAL